MKFGIRNNRKPEQKCRKLCTQLKNDEFEIDRFYSVRIFEFFEFQVSLSEIACLSRSVGGLGTSRCRHRLCRVEICRMS